MNSPLAVVVMGVSGCGKTDLGPVWFPLKEGTSITYAVTQTGDDAPKPEEWTLSVSAPATLDQVPVAVRHHSLGVSYYLRHDEQGLRRVIDGTTSLAEVSRTVDLTGRYGWAVNGEG